VFLVAVLPTMGLVSYSWVAVSDKYVYLPSIGLLMLATAFLARLWEGPSTRRRAVRRVGAVGVVLVLAGVASACTRRSLVPWRDTLGLCQHMIKLAPASAPVRNNLGLALADAGRPGEAIEQFRRITTTLPDYAEAHYNLGWVLASEGRPDEAIAAYEQALAVRPDDPKTHNNLGDALLEQGKPAEAVEHFQEAVRIMPDFADAHYNLGCVRMAQGAFDEAIDHFQQSLSARPAQAEAHNNLGSALRARGRLDEAVRHHRRALEIEPGYANALAAQGKLDDAIGHYRRAVAIAPQQPRAHVNLGRALSARGAQEEAVRHFRQAVELAPDDPALLNGIAWILATHPDGGVAEAEEAIGLAELATGLTEDRDPRVLDTLAAAYAAAGRFDLAVTTAEKALALAESSGFDQAADRIRQRLRGYDRQTPHREPVRMQQTQTEAAGNRG
jgi:Tfp pilus assembly protein PilF